MATTIEATYRVVTPLFCAGADPDRPELRLPSFKGVLRYWWRALAWSRCRGDLARIAAEEDALFGSAAGGQSRVSMRLSVPSAPRTISAGTVLTVPGTGARTVGEGARYLGYGVMEAFASQKKNTQAGQLTRGCLREPFEFTVSIRARNLANDELGTLERALAVVGTVGCMGAKSRKGYGSLVLRSVRSGGNEAWAAPETMDDLKEKLGELRADADLPPYTALSRQTRHVLLSADKKQPIELLDLVGRELVRYRSWGRNGKILGGGVDSEKQFEDDHDLMKKPKAERKEHPRRIAFGLPHNYGKPKDLQVGPMDEHLDRRASPLFVHIHECSGTPVAVVSFLPARFLPDGKSDISVGGKQVSLAPQNDLYRPIHAFLDRLLDPEQRVEPFTAALEVTA